MQRKFILTAFGKDRPGIVAGVTQLIYENGGNLEDTTMSRLAGEFAIILLFTCEDDGSLEDTLSAAFRRLEVEKQISAYFKPAHALTETGPTPTMTQILHIEGLDQAGIVYKISRHLADRDINITNLRSTVTPASGSGTPIYSIDVEIELPDSVVGDTFDKGLEEIANELNVEITRS